jgi:hypothetical protein
MSKNSQKRRDGRFRIAIARAKLPVSGLFFRSDARSFVLKVCCVTSVTGLGMYFTRLWIPHEWICVARSISLSLQKASRRANFKTGFDTRHPAGTKGAGLAACFERFLFIFSPCCMRKIILLGRGIQRPIALADVFWSCHFGRRHFAFSPLKGGDGGSADVCVYPVLFPHGT